MRIAVAQRVGKFDWLAELAENTVFDVPTTSVDPVAARGQLFLGGTYYAANGPMNTTPSAASLKQGWLRYHGKGPDSTLRIGRFEFFDGAETTPKDSTLLWLQTNRIAQRLVGSFGFSNGQRSFDGIDGHFGKGTWDITGMAGRADQGVFNMNANPELNVDIQYLAYSKRQFKDHLLFRAFALDYHDGRTGLTKTDNRTAAARALDHKNIRIGSYGADVIASFPAGPGSFDGLFWGVLQNGNWGLLGQHSGAFAAEAGYRLTGVASKPWLRGGAFRSTGDHDNTDSQHTTFFAILPTPRLYARFPFYNSMNSKDAYIQLIDNPSKRWDLRSDMHFLQLTSNSDFLYNGGGAYDNKVFGVTGRPANLHNSLASIFDISSDYALSPSLSVNTYYAHAYGRTVISSLYAGKQANFGYLELIYKFGIKQRDRDKVAPVNRSVPTFFPWRIDPRLLSPQPKSARLRSVRSLLVSGKLAGRFNSISNVSSWWRALGKPASPRATAAGFSLLHRLKTPEQSILSPMASPPIRVLVAKPGLDGHDRGAKIIARALRDAGMEVIYTGLRQTPEMIVSAAIQEDVDCIGLSILSGAHNVIVPRIHDLLVAGHAEDILLVLGGTIPAQDESRMKAAGVAAIFGPGTSLQTTIDFIRTHTGGRSSQLSIADTK